MRDRVPSPRIAKSASTSKVRVGAPMVPGSITWDNATRALTFQLQGETKNLVVNYRGFASESFRDGATAIVVGELNREGMFTAYNLLIKCPHQYALLF
jgi:cytochrome c-type biogenesis protein CcmE